MPAWLQGLLEKLNWKLLAGISLIALSAFAFWENIWRTVATEAYVNAALAGVASPIPGRVSKALSPIGSRVPAGFELSVVDERADLGATVEIDSKLAQVNAELAASQLKIEALEKARQSFARWTREFGQAKGGFLDKQVAQAKARVEARRADVDRQTDEVRRLRMLPEGAVAEREVIAAQATLTAVENELAAQQAEYEGLVISRQALRGGVQIADGLPDRTYSDQKAQELALDLATEQAKREGLIVQQTALHETLKTSREQLDRLREAHIPVPEGIVWRRIPENSFVAAGGALGAIAVCSEIVLTATLNQRDSKRVFVGQKVNATLLLPDSRQLKTEGTVVGLTGPTIENAQGMAIPFGRAAKPDGYGAIVRPSNPGQLECRVGAQLRLEFVH